MSIDSPTIHPVLIVVGRAATLGAALLLLSACAASGSTTQDDTPTTTVDDPLVDSLAASYAQDMQDLGNSRPPASRTGTPVPGNTGIFIEPIQPAPTPTTQDAATDAPPAEASTAVAPPSNASPDVPALARQLAAALRRRAIEGVSPYEDLSRVAMLEGIAPGVLEGLGDDAASDSSDLIAILAPSERDALRAARRTARALAESDAADPALAADALRAAAESLDRSQDIRIRTAALCTSVVGFARYQTFDSNTFLAGRPIPMIVYAEIDRFRQHPVNDGIGSTIDSGAPSDAANSASSAATQGPPSRAANAPASTSTPPAPPGSPNARFVVNLTQSLNLYFSSGGLLVWRRAPQSVTDYSTARFRDFYIIDTIELPATLAAGEYSLKVIVRDEATGQQTESIIPITLVADEGLARGG